MGLPLRRTQRIQPPRPVVTPSLDSLTLGTAQEPKRGTFSVCPLRSRHIADRQLTKAQDIFKAEIRGDVERDEEARLRMSSDGCFSGLTIARSDSPCFPGAWS